MKVFVTGSAGFIGSHLVEDLIALGHEVVGVDNFDPFYSRDLKEINIRDLKKHHNFLFFEADLNDSKKIEEIFARESIDVVIHLAAKAGVRPSLADPISYCKANIEATVALMEAMRERNVKKLIFASSSSVYGKTAQVPFKEDNPLEDAISVYAATKQAGEKFTQMYHNLYHLDVINLRFFTVYGPRQRPDLAINKFLKANLTGSTITLFGDGSMARDYTYVKDTVAGITGALKRILDNEKVYETYNLGNSTPVTLSQLIEAIENVTGRKCEVQHKDVPLGDVPVTYADISHSEKYLGYKPQTPLEEGLTYFKNWMLENILVK